MHRCLQIPEIIHQVFEKFTWLEQKNVLALALSSKHFLEPGLDTLWESLDFDTPHALRQFFVPSDPNSFQGWLTGCSGINMMELAQLLQITDHVRFNYYAARIKSMTVSTTGNDWRFIMMGIAFHQLSFSNLRNLSWSIRHDDPYQYFSCLKLFVGVKLTSLSLTICGEDWEYDGPLFVVLWSVRDACPNLEYLELWLECDEAWPSSGGQIALVLSCLQSPSHVVLRAEPSSEGWLCLSKMRRLLTLTGSFLPENLELSDTVASLTRPLEFPVLQHLTWPAQNLQDYTAWFQGLQSRREFRTLDLEVFQGCGTEPETRAFIHSLSAACSPETLTFLSVKLPYHRRPTDITTTLASDVLRPLLDFRRIEVCEIDSCVAIWDDALLQEISRAWPNLRRLCLQTDHEPHLSTVTLPGLIPIAQKCIRLEDLVLTVDVDSSDLPGTQISRRNWDHGPGEATKISITVVLLYDLPPEGSEYRAVAKRFLEAIFPSKSKLDLFSCCRK